MVLWCYSCAIVLKYYSVVWYESEDGKYFNKAKVGSRMGVCTLERFLMAEVSGTGVSGRLQICGGLASQWFDSTSAAPSVVC